MNQLTLKLRILLLCDQLFIFLFSIAVLYSVFYTNFYSLESKYNLNDNKFIGIITKYNIDGNKLSFEFKSNENLTGIYYFKTEKELQNFKNNMSLGDKLELIGELNEPKENTIPNTFNYKKYLYNNKTFYILKLSEYKLIEKNKNFFYKVKNYILARISNINNNKYVYAFVVGDTYNLTESVLSSYRTNGISHLFALSGMNVLVLVLIVDYACKFIKLKTGLRWCVMILTLSLISFITGFIPSVMRSCIFFFLLEINKTFYLYIKTINILLLTFVLLVLPNPFLIYDLGFQLSFTITFFLILSSDYLKKENKFYSLFLVSLLSFIASIPIVIYNFYYINFMGVIYNLFFVPYVSYIVFPLAMLTFVFPFLNSILLYSTNIMESISVYLSNITVFTVNYPKISTIFILIYYILLILFIKFKRKKYVFSLLVLLVINYLIPYFDSNTYIYFIDVGQGDSALIVTPYKRKSILIDTGGKITFEKESWMVQNKETSLMKSSLIYFYRSIGLKKIDYLILTHGDADHLGYSSDLIANFNIKKIYINKGEVNYLEKKLNYNIFNEEYLKIDNIEFFSLNNKIYTNENENSLVFLTKINVYKFLFMGDATIKVEKEIIKNYMIDNIFILKAGHHGSDTSSSEELIKTSNPKYAIISAGKNNKYNHPKASVINRLKFNKTEILNTMDDGTIIVKISKKEVDIY